MLLNRKSHGRDYDLQAEPAAQVSLSCAPSVPENPRSKPSIRCIKDTMKGSWQYLNAARKKDQVVTGFVRASVYRSFRCSPFLSIIECTDCEVVHSRVACARVSTRVWWS
jgi:hypothetical protein